MAKQFNDEMILRYLDGTASKTESKRLMENFRQSNENFLSFQITSKCLNILAEDDVDFML